MKRILLIAAASLLALSLFVASAWAFGTKDVIAMHRAGIPDSLVVQKIRYSGANFHLNTNDITKLKSEGISDTVISAMLRTEARASVVYYDPYWGPYWWYDGPHFAPYSYYYGPYYPRVSVGFNYAYRGGVGHVRRF